MESSDPKGIVYLVGGGPGDPELLTLKGLNCLKKCDVVIYDALVNPKLLNHCSEKTEKNVRRKETASAYL